MSFRLRSPILNVTTMATGTSIRELKRLQKAYGKGRWLKRKGIGQIELGSGIIRLAELHWYEAHGIGPKEMKIKRLLDTP